MLVPEFGNGKQALGCFDLLEVARHVGSQDHVYDQRAEFPVLFPRQVHQDVAVFLPHQSDAETEVNNLVDLMRFLCFLFVLFFVPTWKPRWCGGSPGRPGRCTAKPSPSRTWRGSYWSFPCAQSRVWWRPKGRQRSPNRSANSAKEISFHVKTKRFLIWNVALMHCVVSERQPARTAKLIPSFRFDRGCSGASGRRQPRAYCCDRGCGACSSRLRFGSETTPKCYWESKERKS